MAFSRSMKRKRKEICRLCAGSFSQSLMERGVDYKGPRLFVRIWKRGKAATVCREQEPCCGRCLETAKACHNYASPLFRSFHILVLLPYAFHSFFNSFLWSLTFFETLFFFFLPRCFLSAPLLHDLFNLMLLINVLKFNRTKKRAEC